MSTIFISHSSRDNEIAAMMRQRLAERGHSSVFLDFDPAVGIPVGQSWERTLYRKLEACDVVIVLFSDNHNASKWCFAEVALARMQGKHLITFLVDPIGDSTTVPPILEDYQYGDMRTHPEQALDLLWRGLDKLGIHPARVRSWSATSPPYPGMLAFDETQESIYFGRETETRALIALLSAARRRGTDRFVVVQGASGSGKSSLVRAGVVPRLRNDRHQWTLVGPLRAGANPMEQLAGHFARAFGDVFSRDDVMSQLATGGLERAAFENRLRSDSPETTMPLVVIDQFEELLTCDDADGAADLLHLLDEACASDEVNAQLLVTLRSDFVAELDRLDVPAMLRSRRDFSVGPMRTADMRRTITEPARLGALDLEDGLVDRLLEDTGTADGLPLLAFALRKLWDEAHHDGRLEVSEYERLGGLSGALADEAEAVLDAQPGGSVIREEIAAAFLRMSRLGTDGGYTRVTTIWNSHPESIHTALEQFVDRRILVSAGGDQGRTVRSPTTRYSEHGRSSRNGYGPTLNS